MAKTQIYKNQISLPVAAYSNNEAVRKQEFEEHVGGLNVHVPGGGSNGQVLVSMFGELKWMWPVVTCPNGGRAYITFGTIMGIQGSSAQTMSGVQGVDINVLREVEIV